MVQSSVSVAIDNMAPMGSGLPLTSAASTNSSTNSLAAISGLTQSDHLITLTVHTFIVNESSPSSILFDCAVVNVSTDSIKFVLSCFTRFFQRLVDLCVCREVQQ